MQFDSYLSSLCVEPMLDEKTTTSMSVMKKNRGAA